MTFSYVSNHFARSLAVVGVLMLTGVSCSGDAAGPEFEDLDVAASGKLDGWSSVRSLYRDMRNVDLGDLLSVSTGLATNELNDALSTDGLSAELEAPALYALSEEVEDDLTLNDIDELVSGLASRYGERELTTEVNTLRRDHLRNSDDEVFAEGAFRVEAGYDHAWNIPAGGLEDVAASLGFDSRGALETRVIAPFSGELPATGGIMLDSLQASRGFVLPRRLEDIRDMAQGESFALRGSGRMALNLGAGVPLLVAEPTSALTYNLVFSAALRTMMEGVLDVQLVRLDGDEVVVDIGVENARVLSARVAIEDGWGVDGLVELEVEIGGFSVDLGRLAERALERRLNRNLNLISARAERTNSDTRVSVARFRFSLGRGSEAQRTALAHVLHGDVRLAQALANRGEEGIIAEFDLTRSGVSTVSHAGIDLFGMRFFTSTEESEGAIVIQTPGGASTLLFESLHEESGWFFSSHGYTRVGLAGLIFDPEAPGVPDGQTNLLLQVMEGDDYMERDKLLDHLDGVILGIGGREALVALEGPGNELERYVYEICNPSPAFDPCRSEVLSDPHVVELRAQGLAALEAELSGVETDLRELALAVGELRLTAQATREPGASLVGPPTSVVVDFRLDNDALYEVLAEGRAYDLELALTHYLEAAEINRGDSPEQISNQRDDVIDDSSGVIAEIVERFTVGADEYNTLCAAENANIEGLGTLGDNALELRFPVNAENTVLYEEATARSIAQARSQSAIEIYDELVELADDLDGHPEQVVTFALLALADPRRTDLRVNIQMDMDDSWAQDYEHYREAGYGPLNHYAHGSLVSFIDGGLFDVDALLNVDR